MTGRSVSLKRFFFFFFSCFRVIKQSACCNKVLPHSQSSWNLVLVHGWSCHDENILYLCPKTRHESWPEVSIKVSSGVKKLWSLMKSIRWILQFTRVWALFDRSIANGLKCRAQVQLRCVCTVFTSLTVYEDV